MSALAGIYSRGGAPIRRSVLACMSRGLRQMGPDGESFAYSTSVAMLHRPFHTDGESRLTAQPVVTPDGYMLSFDGRLDNAAEVRQSLGRSLAEGSRSVDLVLAAYRQWGISGFGRLIGDFALAIWDPEARCLLLCCDSLGRRPLYYRITAEHVVWSSWCRPLLAGTGIPLEVDEEYVADFLTNRPTTHSPFRGISLVPGGHVLIVYADREDLTRYWSFDPGREISYRTDREYEEHFTGLFEEAVACRLQTDGPVFCELSGGVDSSTIVCVADRLLRSGAVEAPGLHTVSYVFDSARSADERAFIHLVEEQVGRRGLHISEDRYPLLQPPPASFVPDLPTNQICYLSRQDHLAGEMERLGSRVVLSGIGGDQLFWSEPPPGLPLMDLLAQGRLVDLVRRCSAWSLRLQWPFLKMLWVGACRPLLPRWIQTRGEQISPLGEWVDGGFARRMNLRERSLGMTDDLEFRLPSSALQYGYLRQTMRIFALERCLSEGYIDVRYPYLDRRLMEFALAIPLEQKVRPGESRSIVRRAFRGILADPLRNRTTKSGPTEAFHRALIHEWRWLSGLLSDSRVAAYGFMNGEALLTALTRARHGLVSNSVQLKRTISLELWLRTLETSRDPDRADPASPPRRPGHPRAGSRDVEDLVPTV